MDLYEKEKAARQRVRELEEAWEQAPAGIESNKAKLALDAAIAKYSALVKAIDKDSRKPTHNEEVDRMARFIIKTENAESEHKKKNPFSLSGLYKGFKNRITKYTKNAKNKKRAHNELVAKRKEQFRIMNRIQNADIKKRSRRNNNNNNNNNNNQYGGTRRRRKA